MEWKNVKEQSYRRQVRKNNNRRVGGGGEVRELVTEKLSKNRFDGVEKDPEFAAEDRQKTYSVEWNKSHRISYRRPPRTDPMEWKKLHGYDLSSNNTYRRPLKTRTEGMEERLGISFRRTSRTESMVWKNSIELATEDRQGTDTMEMIFYGLSYRRL